MRITIKYEASWRNSFLNGSNNEPLPKGGRGFVGSMTNLSKRENDQYPNFIKRDISIDTVMGVLNRLIGDQRKLYQSRNDKNYFFSDIENKVTFQDMQDKEKPINEEMIYIRNITGSTDQNAFSGMVNGEVPTFNSPYSREFWGVLWLPFEQLLNFFKNDAFLVPLNIETILEPISVLNRSNYLKDELKPVDIDLAIQEVIEALKNKFPDQSYIETSGKLLPIRLYAAALYIQAERLKKRFDTTGLGNQRGDSFYVFGYSKRSFNGIRDFMKNFITGEAKTIWGNPYVLKERRKGEGEVTHLLTKANGTLEINLDIPLEKAQQLKEMIEAAGVSSFYLGKKGLAYVDGSIRL